MEYNVNLALSQLENKDISYESLKEILNWFDKWNSECQKKFECICGANASIARRLSGMFSHHINHFWFKVEMGKELLKKRKITKEDYESRKAKFANELNTCINFVKKCNEGNWQDKVTFADIHGTETYTAIKENNQVVIYHYLKKEDVEAEKKRLRKIIKDGGAWYYKEMLDELCGKKTERKRYIIE